MAAASSTHPRARRRSRAPAARVRWDRVGRRAMLFVMVALAYLYLSAGFHMFSSWRQSRHDRAAVVSLEHEHRQLLSQHARLTQPGTLEAQARQLGMIKPDERAYVVTGLPGN
jgi:cytochrome c-type biogenesis protein CcmH/NrfG